MAVAPTAAARTGAAAHRPAAFARRIRRVVGVGQQGKTGEATKGVYDDYEVMTHRKGRAQTSSVATKAAAKKAAPAKSAAKKPAPTSLPDKVAEILNAVPALARGETLELNVVAAKLREAKLLSKSGSSTKLFQQFPELFVLEPAKQPHKVRAVKALST